MGTLLPKLFDILQKEYQLQKKTRGEIMWLMSELESMQIALLKISEAPIDQPPDEQVKLWAKNVRDLTYDIEDNIDKFVVRIDTPMPNNPHSFRGFIERSLDLMTKAKIRRKIGLDIRDIKSRINEEKERRDSFIQRAFKTVGIEEKTDYLVRRLMEGPDEELRQQQYVVSIVGFGGLGKTTLAMAVYKELKEKFDCGAFVSISLSPNMVGILKNMLHQLDEEKYCNINGATWDEGQLIDELREFLKKKRYIIVIDDVWDNSHWQTIRYALAENELGSRIIMTTRIVSIAKQIGGAYQLEPLSLDDSRKLFDQIIFPLKDKCLPYHLSEVSQKILKKCGGIPLAIITIASMLASKKGNEHEHWYKVYNSMGSGLEDKPDLMNMRKILSISYYDLVPHLKTCLLYLSLYPEDYVFTSKTLIWKWVGEGFVETEQGSSLYEAGREYFDELMNKSMIQPVDEDGLETRYRIHDMVLDLITFISIEEHYLTRLDGHQSLSLPKKIRRLSLQTNVEEDVKQLATISLCHLRSLTVSEQSFNLLPSTLSSLCPLLRVLDLNCDGVENQHCKDICNLLHLRYLKLSCDCITELPKEIANLQFLQVLDIYHTHVKELPPSFIQLKRLVYLHVNGWYMRLPDDLGSLDMLQEIGDIFYIDNPTMLHNLGGLAELRSLSIDIIKWDESYDKAFIQCLSKLVSLEFLKVIGTVGSTCGSNLSPGPQRLRSIDMSDCTLTAVPRWMSSLSSLSTLSITLLTLGEEDLQILGDIPSLNYLDIQVRKATPDRNKRLVIDNVSPFQCLTQLSVVSVTMEVRFAPGAMQNLRNLEFYINVRETVDQFGDFDFGLENLSSLDSVGVRIWGSDSKMSEADDAETAIRRSLHMNGKNPTINLHRHDWA
uniref:AAA+ ATPase domain-containing protein n=1 Tax=Leersia perrieri TaxID=77586 RepID=A0A0D9XT13_9ORYZ